MCGICGIVHSTKEQRFNPELVNSMCHAIAHRGPDDKGTYLAEGVALGSTRLAILDLSDQGHMPMSTPDARYRMVYNGEVYNYHALRHQLEQQGVVFRSNTDTEVVLQLFVEYGHNMLEHLQGMFALAIWDTHERELFLARDRIGIKPLCYALHDGSLYFASEEKALLVAGIPDTLNSDSLEELLYFRFVSGEQTVFKHIKRLLPGHFATWRDGHMSITRWWHLGEKAQEHASNLAGSTSDWYREAFDRSIQQRLISDVPLGILLSGGLDSSSVAAATAQQAGDKLSSFTVRFDEINYDEGNLAQMVAERWNLEFESLIVSPQNVYSLLQDASWLHDAPLAHGNDGHLLAISRYAKNRVTVLLSGEGGDETLGGYVRYRPLQYPQLMQGGRLILPPLAKVLNLPSRWNKLARFLQQGNISDMVYYNSADLLPVDIDADITPNIRYRLDKLREATEIYPNDPVRQVMYLDQHTFMCSLLERNDRMTMGASIECRVPFLDHRIVETLASLPTSSFIRKNRNKALLRDALGERLPSELLTHRKWGFGIPWSKYFREIPELNTQVRTLTQHPLIEQLPLSKSIVKQIVGNFAAGSDRDIALIKQLALTAIWYDTFQTRISEMQSEGVL